MTRAPTVWRTEVELWEYLVKRLRGTWHRLELSYPHGLCDSVGLWNGQTIWLEHKVGKPDTNAFEHTQLRFAHDCARHHVPWWCCFGYRGRAMFFASPALTVPVSPPFWISPEEVLAGIAARLPQTAP